MTTIITQPGDTAMPMIDVFAVAGTFADKRALTKDLTAVEDFYGSRGYVGD